MEMTAVASRGQEVVDNNGEEMVASQKRHLVLLSPYSEYSHITRNKMMFMMYVRNNGETPICLNNDSLSVLFVEKGKDGNSYVIDILGAGKFVEDFRKEVAEYEFRAFKSASRDILDETRARADLIHSSHSNSGNLSKSQISADYKANQEKFQEEMDALADESDRVREQNRKFFDGLQQTVMRQHTILPGSGRRSLVACDTGKMEKDKEGTVKVIVSVAGEVHEFTFERSLNNIGE
jgi:hypothetical protein